MDNKQLQQGSCQGRRNACRQPAGMANNHNGACRLPRHTVMSCTGCHVLKGPKRCHTLPHLLGVAGMALFFKRCCAPGNVSLIHLNVSVAQFSAPGLQGFKRKQAAAVGQALCCWASTRRPGWSFMRPEPTVLPLHCQKLALAAHKPHHT